MVVFSKLRQMISMCSWGKTTRVLRRISIGEATLVGYIRCQRHLCLEFRARGQALTLPGPTELASTLRSHLGLVGMRRELETMGTARHQPGVLNVK